MQCPKCKSKTKVKDSREGNEAIYRKRICENCKYIFFTEEIEVENVHLYKKY